MALKETSVGALPGRETIGPLFLITVCPVFAILMWHTSYALDGSFLTLLTNMYETGPVAYTLEVWPTPFHGEAVRMIAAFAAVELAMMRLVPGKEFRATTTPKGNVPVYNANGMQCYVLSVVGMLALTEFGVIEPGRIYDVFGHCLSFMCFFALLFCAMLTVKGRTFPSTTDSGTTGSLLHDFYWGTELYPRILGWDVKVFTNCRFGMMFWACGILAFAHAQLMREGAISTSMFVSVALQLVYISKFFWWESGYMCSMDIQHDRAGYYICWGCMVWVPCVYTSQTFYLIDHPVHLSLPVAALNFVAGVLAIWCNYDADNQRWLCRSSNGECKIWGAKPDVIVAKYTVGDGADKKEKTSLLLVSGWWSISRHFHYVPEILASFLWSCPAGFDSFMPYFYVVYLTILLVDRAWRDDERCSNKYGKHWAKYCERVPWKIVPGIA